MSNATPQLFKKYVCIKLQQMFHVSYLTPKTTSIWKDQLCLKKTKDTLLFQPDGIVPLKIYIL